MRLFIALDLDNEEYFKELQNQLNSDNLKASFPKSFHLTLKFLGETDKTQQIIEALKSIKFKELNLKTTKIGVFPNENYIRVIWLGLDDNQELEKLQNNIEKALEPFKFKKDYNDFHPHITLARVKFIKDKEALKQLMLKIQPKPLEFKINKFSLYSSELTSKGPIYKEIKSFSSY